MTSVNSPACLLARNQFYRNTRSPTESTRPTTVYSLSDWSTLAPKQRQVTVWVTMSTQPGFPGAGGISRGRRVSVVLGSSTPRTAPVKSPQPSQQSCPVETHHHQSTD
ncbi:hypothetical protein J4Q44_G00218630 [Coregonus suidteri]|uniref:Uncharacterized protein n=1 Tax=Coregonus suidteri TaxID=861788 RepID=A0AAN8LHG4_9TELE